MTAVSELVEDVSEIMGERRETVNAYARALIDAGLLPKSSGRAIAHVEPRHVVHLVMAVAISPKIKDAARVVEEYGALVSDGVPEGAPDRIVTPFEEFLSDVVEILMPVGPIGEAYRELRDVSIEIIETWPEVIVIIPDTKTRPGRVQYFSPRGQPATHWRAFTKRSATIHGRAFVALGTNSDRDYFQIEAASAASATNTDRAGHVHQPNESKGLENNDIE